MWVGKGQITKQKQTVNVNNDSCCLRLQHILKNTVRRLDFISSSVHGSLHLKRQEQIINCHIYSTW